MAVSLLSPSNPLSGAINQYANTAQQVQQLAAPKPSGFSAADVSALKFADPYQLQAPAPIAVSAAPNPGESPLTFGDLSRSLLSPQASFPSLTAPDPSGSGGSPASRGFFGGIQAPAPLPASPTSPTNTTPQGTNSAVTSLGGDWAGVDQWNSAIQAAASATGIDPNLIKAVMQEESGGDPNASGAPGVWGPMQVNSSVDAWGVGAWSTDANANIMKGAQILKYYLDANGGNVNAALIGYHGGPNSDGNTTGGQYADIINGYYNQLQSGGSSLPVTTPGRVTGDNPAGLNVLNVALSYVGKAPYVWGGIPGKGQDPTQTGWDTVHEDTGVLMGDGSTRKIKQIEPGELIMTYTSDGPVPASVRMVYKKGVKAMIRIETTRTIHRTTANHPFLVYDAKKRISSLVDAANLREMDMLLAVRPATSDSPDPDVAWIVGLMVGNGNINGRSLNLCVYGDIRERASDILARVTESVAGHDEKHGIFISCAPFAQWLRDIGLGVHAHEKRVPDVVWRWDDAARASFLLGYLQTDGSLCDGCSYAIASASQDLTIGIRDLAASLGHKVSGYRKQERTKEIQIKGRVVKNARPLYWSRVRLDPTDRSYPWDFVTVCSLNNDDPAPAYDLSIDHPSETFIADGVVVHNCSGMTYWLDQNYGAGQLPMGSHYQYQYAQQTGRLDTNINNLQPGDLVFIDTGWMGGAGSELNRAGHVAVYLGNGKIVQAANPDSGTIVSDLSSYNGGGYGTFLGGMHMSWSSGVAGGFGPATSSGASTGMGSELSGILARLASRR